MDDARRLTVETEAGAASAMHLPAGRVTVSGRLLADQDGVVTIEPRQRHDQLHTSATGPIEPRSPTHLRLKGLGNTALPGARRDATHVQAWPDLTGEITPEDGAVRVHRRNPLTTLTDFWTPGPAVSLDVELPPVPPGAPFDLSPLPDAEQRLIADGVILSRKALRTRHGGRVLVVATTAPGDVERHLRPIYGRRLHIRASPWTVEQYRAALDTLNDHHDRWHLLLVGDHTDAHGQVVIVVSSVDEDPGLIAWLAGQPPGLVDHRPWVHRRNPGAWSRRNRAPTP